MFFGMKPRANILDSDALDSAIKGYERRANAIKQIKEILAEFPDLLDGIAHNANADPIIPRKRNRPSGELFIRLTNFDKVKEFFLNNGNPWTSAPELAAKLGWSRGVASNVLYTTNRHAFEQRPFPGSDKKVQWRLRVDRLENETDAFGRIK